jgi:hypothetical protein
MSFGNANSRGCIMIRYKSVVRSALLALVLCLVPLTSAFAQHRYHGNPFWPVTSLAAAVVGTAAAIVTAPLVIASAVANAPYYAPAPAYVAPVAVFNGGQPVYYSAPQPQAYYYPPAPTTYYSPPPAPVYYSRPAAPVYYGPPVVRYYAPPAAVYYTPAPRYYYR